MENISTEAASLAHKHIQGWGADLDRANRPAVPKERIPQRLDVPEGKLVPQERNMEVLVSVEYPEMPPLFGTSVPPSGVSGLLREAAFKLSENDIRHWLILLFADRVNMVEGILHDFSRGHIPNIFAEMGWKAKFKHDTARAVAKSAVLAGVLGFATYRLLRNRRDR